MVIDGVNVGGDLGCLAEFMKGLKRRGVKRVWMVISDAHRGHSGSGEEGVVKDGVAEMQGPLYKKHPGQGGS